MASYEHSMHPLVPNALKRNLCWESSLKRRMYFLLVTLAIIAMGVLLIVFFGKPPHFKIYFALLVFIVVLLWGWYRERLIKLKQQEKRKEKAGEIQRQSDWQGQELIVGHRWLKALVISGACGFCAFLLFFFGLSLYSTPTWTLKGILGFTLLVLMLLLAACATWAWLSGFLVAVFRGHSLKIDAEGVHFSGLPALPFAAITRSGYREQVPRHGSVTTFLLLELSSRRLLDVWPRATQALLAGYILIFLSYFRKRDEVMLIQVHAGHWNAPTPTIAAAIRHISEKSLTQPIVEYADYKTLEESRLEHRLFQTITSTPSARFEEDQLQAMYKRFSSGDRLSKNDEETLDKSFGRLDQQMKERSQAIDQFSALQEKSFQTLRERLDRDNKYMPKVMLFFVVLAVLGVIAKVVT